MATPDQMDQMSFRDESVNKQIEGSRLFVNILILAVAALTLYAGVLLIAESL